MVKTYELGIMSSKWRVKAPSLDIAMIVIRLSTYSNAPIVCYNSDEKSKFAYQDSYTDDDLKALCDAEADEIRIAYRTMVEV